MISSKLNSSNLLKLVHYHHPILREVMEPVRFPLSKADRELIQNMKYSIQTEQLKKAQVPFDSAAGMAANQWGIAKRIFLFCPENDNQIEVIINPCYQPLIQSAATQESAQECDWEACFSIPLTMGHVNRHLHIKATYQNETGEMLSKNLSGWLARIWQHEVDHLNGILFDDPKAAKCHALKRFSSKEEYYDSKAQKSNTLLK